MGANPTQALAVTIFLLAFVVIAIAMTAGGNVLIFVVGFGLLAASAMLFRLIKPWEEHES